MCSVLVPLVGSSRKAQKIQIHMKNNRFHNRKASGPAALQNGSSSTAATLQNKQFLLQKQNIVADKVAANYESSIQH